VERVDPLLERHGEANGDVRSEHQSSRAGRSW
jgi:hypothetical protein